MNQPLGNGSAFYLVHLAGFFSFWTQCVFDTLNAPADKLLLSQLIKLGGHSAISGRYGE
jgi:hypothetical protein